MIFNELDFQVLRNLFERPGYAGYRPTVTEAPNGDGKVDAGKRYLHVAAKYNPPEWAMLFLGRAHWEACRIAEAIGVPAAYYPRIADSTLRVLEYPAGAGSERHTDFDLFTTTLYRSTQDGLHVEPHFGQARPATPELYLGELGELVGLGPATPHSVEGLPVVQHSIVYFAMPDHAAVLPGGQTVGEWLHERITRSRYDVA